MSILLLLLGLLPAFAQRPVGVDVSDYQGTINWTSVKSAGVTFAWAKATEGANSYETTFTNNENNAKTAGVLIGAYHYAHPELHPGIAGAQLEAQHFWATSRNWLKTNGFYLQPMLDFEQDLSSAPTTFTKDAASQWANAWCDYLVLVAATNGVALKPVLYTYTSYSSTWLNTFVTNWPLWMASYPSSPNNQTGTPGAYAPWPTGAWAVWQYTGSNTVAGVTHGWDGDVFNGTAATLPSLVITNALPPFFLAQPVISRAVDAGKSVKFSASAGGGLPLSYQWYLNGTNMLNATSPTLNFASAQATNAGYYTLVVSNSFGSITSSPVSLLVYPVQGIVFADNFDTDTATNWIVNKSSADTAVTFNFNYATAGIPSAPNSTGGTTRGVQMQANLSAGVISGLSISPTNQIFSGDYRLHFDAWINVNGPFPGGGAGSTEMLSAGLGTSGTHAEWNGPGSSADGYYFAVDGDGGIAPSSTGVNDYSAFIGATVEASSTGTILAGTDSSARGAANVYYQTAFPSLHTAPASQLSKYPQQTDGLDLGTFGLLWHDVIISKRGNTVDWVIDGIRFGTISNATFTANNVFVGFWDPFSSLSSSNAINFGLIDNVRVESPATLPVFTLQPVAATVPLGTNLTFTAAATGVPSPTYQWQINGTNILNATNASYALAFVTATNAGNYSVIATNFMGAITSTNALLSLLPPAAAQFQSISAAGDGTVQVGFTGTAYWTYTIEVSTNLTSWSSLTNVTSASGLFNVAVSSITNAPQQFFRARVGP